MDLGRSSWNVLGPQVSVVVLLDHLLYEDVRLALVNLPYLHHAATRGRLHDIGRIQGVALLDDWFLAAEHAVSHQILVLVICLVSIELLWMSSLDVTDVEEVACLRNLDALAHCKQVLKVVSLDPLRRFPGLLLLLLLFLHHHETARRSRPLLHELLDRRR